MFSFVQNWWFSYFNLVLTSFIICRNFEKHCIIILLLGKLGEKKNYPLITCTYMYVNQCTSVVIHGGGIQDKIRFFKVLFVVVVLCQCWLHLPMYWSIIESQRQRELLYWDHGFEYHHVITLVVKNVVIMMKFQEW